MDEIFFKDKNFKKALVVVVLLLSLFLLTKSLNELKTNKFIGRDISPVSTISVSGRGEVTAIPDIATFSFTVSEERETVKEAHNVLSQKVSKVLDSLEELDVDDKDIKTLSYNIRPRYDYFTKQQICPPGFSCPPSRGERVLVGYTASQTVSIKLTDIDNVGKVLNSLGDENISNINGPTFDIEDREGLERKARKEAITNAKEKAKRLSKDLGVKLVKIVSFSEGNNFFNQSKGFAIAESFDSDGGVLFAPEIPVGESEIVSTVNIVYEIR